MTELNCNHGTVDEKKNNLGLFAKHMFGDKESHILRCKNHYPTGFPALDESLG